MRRAFRRQLLDDLLQGLQGIGTAQTSASVFIQMTPFDFEGIQQILLHEELAGFIPALG